MQRLLTPTALADHLGVTRETVWRSVQRGSLPRPIYVGSRSPRWRPEEIAEHLDQLAADRDSGPTRG